MATKLPKAFYSEVEACRSLGVTAVEFRTLLRHHLGASETETDRSPETTYHASDIMLLRLFVAGRLDVPPPQPKAVPAPEAVVSGVEPLMAEAVPQPSLS